MALSLLDLPWLVLDNILQYSDHFAYLPLCLTCKALHHPAKMLLYRYSAYTKKRGKRPFLFITEPSVEELESEHILQNRFFQEETWTYGQNVRYYLATDSKGFNHLLRWVPLHLHRLILEVDPRNWVHPQIIHPATVVEEIQIIIKDLWGDYGITAKSIPPNLDIFQGLVSLKINNYQAFPCESQYIMDCLHCPQLKRLEIDGDLGNWQHVRVGGNLPQLESVRFTLGAYSALDHRRLLDKMTESESWSTLQAFMEQRIHVRIVDRGGRDNLETFRFLQTARLFGPRGAAEYEASDWLLKGARYFWSYLPQKLSYSFDFRGFDAHTRELTLKLLKQLPFSAAIDVKFNFRKGCCLPSLIELLPQRTRRLEVFLYEAVGLQFFPQLLSSFDGMTYFACHLRSRIVFDNFKPWSPAEVIDFIVPRRADFVEQHDSCFSNDFLFKRCGEYTWTRVKYNRWEEKRTSFKRDNSIYVGTEEFRKLSKGWFRCNPSLQEIEFKVWECQSELSSLFPFY